MIDPDIIKGSITRYTTDPATILQLVEESFDNILDDDYKLVDPTNPFAALLGMGSSLISGALERFDASSSNHYPKLANDFEDLYRHMSDGDYKNRFCTPVDNVEFTLAIPLVELNKSAIPIPNTNTKKIVFGSRSIWNVLGVKYFHHFPIIVLLQQNNSVQTYFDMTTPSPLTSLRTNVIKNYITVIDNVKYLNLVIPVTQLALETYEYDVTNSTGFKKDIQFDDQFYSARVYSTKNNITTEIKTTHSESVYDTSVLTAVLSVQETGLVVKIPEIYLSNNMVGSQIRVEVYTSKGDITQDLGVIGANNFNVDFFEAKERTDQYSAAIGSLSTYIVASNSKASGGRNEISFEDLRTKVIYGTDDDRAPILFTELENKLKLKGYGVSKLEDNLLGRRFLVTRRAETSVEGLFSSLGTSLSTLTIDTENQTTGRSVNKTNERVTLKPDAIYLKRVGSTELMPDSVINAIDTMPNSNKADFLNNNDFYCSPFYTVLDRSDAAFAIRSYYMEKPAIIDRNYIDSNKDLGYVVNTKEVNIKKYNDKYVLNIVSDIPSDLTELKCQISFDPAHLSGRWYAPLADGSINSAEKTAIFSIDITTSFDIDKEDRIEITNLLLNGSTASALSVDLLSSIDIVYLNDITPVTTTNFDDKFIRNVGGVDYSGVTHESFTVQFGEHLKNLYEEGRPVQNEPVYLKQTTDKPLLHTTDVYQIDANGNIVYTVDSGNNKITLNKLHSIGDVVKDANNETVYEWKIGDWVIGADGRRVLDPSWVKTIKREITLPLFSARYRYADTVKIQEANDLYPQLIVQWLKDDIRPFTKNILERTKVQFAPTNVGGVVAIKTGEISTKQINASFKFKIDLVLTEDGYAQASIRQSIKDIVLKAIVKHLKKEVISTSELYSIIMTSAPSELVSVNLNDFLIEDGIAQLSDSFDSFALADKMVVKTNGELDVEDDIEFIFSKR